MWLKHCPEEANFSRWAKRRLNNKNYRQKNKPGTFRSLKANWNKLICLILDLVADAPQQHEQQKNKPIIVLLQN